MLLLKNTFEKDHQTHTLSHTHVKREREKENVRRTILETKNRAAHAYICAHIWLNIKPMMMAVNIDHGNDNVCLYISLPQHTNVTRYTHTHTHTHITAVRFHLLFR